MGAPKELLHDSNNASATGLALVCADAAVPRLVRLALGDAKDQPGCRGDAHAVGGYDCVEVVKEEKGVPSGRERLALLEQELRFAQEEHYAEQQGGEDTENSQYP